MADGINNVAITAALRGAGGYGKTTLAKALCHDPRIQAAFPDGTLWTTLGQTPGNLAPHVEDLVKRLSGANSGFNNTEAVFMHFKELLAERRMLLVIDDVWDRNHLRPFLQGGPNVARLITTRNLDTIAGHVERENQVTVDAMRLAEAARMLRTNLPTGCDEEFEALADRLGCWPFLLCLANGAARERTAQGESLADALAFVRDDLEENSLFAFDPKDEKERDRAVRTMFGVSLRLLSGAESERFHELAIFPEDAQVPLATVERLWNRSGGMSRVAADKLYSQLYNLSLLLNLNRQTKALQLHDVTRKYLIAERKGPLTAIHCQLLDAHRPPAGWAELPDSEPYLWDHLAEHLVEAGRGEELVATVKDWRYLAKKIFLRKAHTVENDLIQAMKYAPDEDPLRALRRTLANTGHIFNHCETRDDLHSTMFSRLQHLGELQAIVRELARHLASPRIVPKFDLPDLPHPALIRTLEGHSSSVSDCAFSPDGRLIVSASGDSTLKVWDSETGQSLRTLEGHSSSVSGCAFSPDGKLIVSASDDRTLKIWDAGTGQMLRSLEGHSAYVIGCAFSPDGKLIVSASWDGTLKVWDSETGQTLATFFADGPMCRCVVYGGMIAAGGTRGVYFLQLVR